MQNQYDIVIIGAGPAGLIAAIECYSPEKNILILEKMFAPALKLKISGKGRCNITNAADFDDFISHFGKNGRFLKFAFSEFFNTDLIKYFEDMGVRFKLERGGRYFPVKDDAMEIVSALLNKVKTLGISISTNCEVNSIAKSKNDKFIITYTNPKNRDKNKVSKQQLITSKIVLTTGGKSYPKTGSSGTGYKLAAQLGHTITPLSPSLVPIETNFSFNKKLAGLKLKNITATVWCNNKKVAEQFGEMTFADFGVSGPIIITLSSSIVNLVDKKQNVLLSIDFKPALDFKKVDQRILREIENHGKQDFEYLLKKLLPQKLIPVFIEILKIPGQKKLNQINSRERKLVSKLLKEFQLEVTGYRSYNHAIATSGGISIKEISPQTMESKLIKGLHFAGEIIDINADTGGFNLQAAFSTGWIAGRALKMNT